MEDLKELYEEVNDLLSNCEKLQIVINQTNILNMNFHARQPDVYINNFEEGKLFLVNLDDFKNRYLKLNFDSLPAFNVNTNYMINSDELNNIKLNLHIINRFLKRTLDKSQHNKSVEKETIHKSKVFIVHGHDDAAKEMTARFIEKLELTAIILHEQASGGKTIIEKIEQYSDVGFAIVLYTPCDEGKAKNETNYKDRARQNVVFEHGYMIGKLGRENVCALVKGNIERPNDISGVVYIAMDNNNWKADVIKELKAAGYDVDANKIY